MALPKAILVDLDDTILVYGSSDQAWRQISNTFGSTIEGLDSEGLFAAIVESRDWYWSDPDRHRKGRLDLSAARRTIVSSALSRLGLDLPRVAQDIAESYASVREEGARLSRGAIPTLRCLRESGVRLALVTNGAGEAQRDKIGRFKLASLFDYILIEGEFGVGKPDERVYLHALDQLGAQTSEAWMVGDNLEWEVAAPKRLGILTIWFDSAGSGLPASSNIRPDRMIRSLPELLDNE